MSTAFTLPQRLRASFGDADYRRVLNLALPAVGEQMLNMTVGLADTFMVGHLGAAAVAAVGLSNQAVMLVTTFFAAVATGVTALVARHIGAHERDHANTIMHQGYLLSIFFGVLTAAFGLLLSFETMRALRAPADVIGPGTTYLSIVALTFPLAACLFVGNAALRGSGDTRTPMLVMLAVNVVNIGVAYAAIYGLGPIPALGVTGSAIGAATARGAGGLIVTALLFRGRSGLRLRLRRFKPDIVQLKRIANIGLPAGAEQLLMRGAQTAFVVTVASLGTLAYAAHQIALQAESISYMPGFGFAVAATTLVGQGLGARDPKRARADGRLAQWMAVAIMSCMGVIFFLFPAQIIGIFINDPAGDPTGHLAAAAGGVLAADAGDHDGVGRRAARRRRHPHDSGDHRGRAVAGARAAGGAARAALRADGRVDRDERRSECARHAELAAFPRRSLDKTQGLI